MAASKMTLRQRQKTPNKASRVTLSAEASPDSKCPICLDIFNNRSYLDLCLHKFCFRCIHEWSKNKAECPLCKQPFNSIYHSIKSEKDFKKYDIRPTDNGSFGSFGGERFRYRTTLTGVRRQTPRRTSPPPDNGVLFEAVADHAPPRPDRGLSRMMTRLAARIKALTEGRAVRNLREEEMVKFRRELYRLGIRVQSVRDGGRSRDTTAAFYLRNPACLHRLIPWLKRELTVLYGAHGSLVNIVQHIIMSRITHHDMEDGAIQEELRPFLQGRTEHFLHEFISFAKSPFNMEAYDRQAVYDCPAPSSNEDSSSDSSVIAISEDEQCSVELDPPGDSMSSGALSQSAWDDETPGPSYSTTAERSRVQQLSVVDSSSDSSAEEQIRGGAVSPQHRGLRIKSDSSPGAVHNDGCLSSGDDNDCVIIGFVKPVADRTPELVQLSSDSEESVHEVPQLPQHIRFTSVSPSHSRDPGSGGSERGEKENRSGSKERRSPSVSRRDLPSGKSERKPRGHHNGEVGRHHGGDKSREKRRSRRRSMNTDRSPVISAKIDSAFSRGRRRSPSSSGERSYSRREIPDKRRDRELGRSGSNHEPRSHSYNWQSYSHYSWDKENSETHYSESRSYYSSCHKNPDRRSHSRSRSHSRESRRGDGSRSRSRSYSTSCSPSTRKKSRHDKPGGKRKYKTRHLEEPSKPEQESSASCAKDKKKKKSKEKRHKKSKESKEKSGKRSRSLSVEIIYEGSSPEQTKKHHKKKKKHKKKSKRHRSKERAEKHSSAVITIDSDSDNSADGAVHQAGGGNEDDPVSGVIGAPVDPAPPGALVQAQEHPILEGLDKGTLKTGSSQTTDTSGDIVEQCDVPQSEDEKSSKDEVSDHMPSTANTAISSELDLQPESVNVHGGIS